MVCMLRVECVEAAVYVLHPRRSGNHMLQVYLKKKKTLVFFLLRKFSTNMHPKGADVAYQNEKQKEINKSSADSGVLGD